MHNEKWVDRLLMWILGAGLLIGVLVTEYTIVDLLGRLEPLLVWLGLALIVALIGYGLYKLPAGVRLWLAEKQQAREDKAMEPLRRMISLVGEAKDKAYALSLQLGTNGDPQSSEATALFQELSQILRLLLDEEQPPLLAALVGRLTPLPNRCGGRLSELKSRLDEAVWLASHR
jgi:hypothetical protein